MPQLTKSFLWILHFPNTCSTAFTYSSILFSFPAKLMSSTCLADLKFVLISNSGPYDVGFMRLPTWILPTPRQFRVLAARRSILQCSPQLASNTHELTDCLDGVGVWSECGRIVVGRWSEFIANCNRIPTKFRPPSTKCLPLSNKFRSLSTTCWPNVC